MLLDPSTALRSRPAAPAILAAGLGLAYLVAPTTDGPVTCLLRMQTGHACPACGMTRALGRLVHGDLVGAVAYHPWIVALAVQVVALTGLAVWWGARPMEARHLRWGLWLGVANGLAMVAVWIARMATGHLAGVY
ncbi:MAG: DUF2752 domain-containing protein [Actinomycetota bacterium]